MNRKKVINSNFQNSKRNQKVKVKNNTVSSQTPDNFNNNDDKISMSKLDWNNHESIYTHLISYINLMIIDLSKDKEKLCKYLKDIFYSVFKISQEIKNPGEKINEEKNNISLNNKQNNSNEEWNFLTGEQFIRKSNDSLMEQLLKEETKNEINNVRPLLTQRFESSKSFNVFQISPFKNKIDRLQRKFKQKEKQYKIDKLNYLFKINEQNNIINKLEKEIQINNINNMSQKDLNKIKCYPDFSFITENYLRNNNSSINKRKKLFEINKEKENEVINNMKYLSITNGNKENKRFNLKDVLNKNLSLLKNKGSMKKTRFMRFASFSIGDTRNKVEKIKNYKLYT